MKENMQKINPTKIQLFKIYKMTDKLKKSISKFASYEIDRLLPILYIGDDIIFGEVRNVDQVQENEDVTDLYNHEKMWDSALYYKNFYRMNSKILNEYIYEDEETISLGQVSEVNELNILDKLKYYFTTLDADTKLTYIYPKKNTQSKSIVH
ncbi:hypothetical protein BCF59_0082 [Mycoplasmopsis mustelae]|uniref:Uncharacterized protein n=1 Tax=Mycoplasmopsis mustelae TaxID=171289 RepID=A0A4R7UES1_9BACT|nr:hypothetical protein [Mycoplasmopsis mustelae]TDV24135.1 hypothetical protein BCF59_0082 [Mycoplasmopsis mustelae]